MRRLLPLLLVFVALAAGWSVAVAQSSATTKAIMYHQAGHHAVLSRRWADDEISPSPTVRSVEVAMPLLVAVEHAALRARVPVAAACANARPDLPIPPANLRAYQE